VKFLEIIHNQINIQNDDNKRHYMKRKCIKDPLSVNHYSIFTLNTMTYVLRILAEITENII